MGKKKSEAFFMLLRKRVSLANTPYALSMHDLRFDASCAPAVVSETYRGIWRL